MIRKDAPKEKKTRMILIRNKRLYLIQIKKGLQNEMVSGPDMIPARIFWQGFIDG